MALKVLMWIGIITLGCILTGLFAMLIYAIIQIFKSYGLYKQGYRKIPKNAVVLTREEYTNYMVEYMGVKEIKDRVIKETAEKILEQVKFLIEERNCVGGYDLEDETIDGTIFVEVLNELKERYGVEVEE